MQIHHYESATAAHDAAVIDANAGHHVLTFVLGPDDGTYNLVDPERVHLPFLVGFIEDEQFDGATLRSLESNTLVASTLDTFELFGWVRALAGRTSTHKVYVHAPKQNENVAETERRVLTQLRVCALFGDVFLIATGRDTWHVCLDETHFKQTLFHEARQPEGTVRAERVRYVDNTLTRTDIALAHAHRVARRVDQLFE